MNLYHVQDSERPMYVIANDYGHAVSLWSRQISSENDDETPDPPDGVCMVACGTDVTSFPEILLPHRK